MSTVRVPRHFRESAAPFSPGFNSRIVSPQVSDYFGRWLRTHDRLRGHHWSERSQAEAQEAELDIRVQCVDLPITTAADLAAIVLIITAFGEFELPPEFFCLVDRLVRPSFDRHQDDPSEPRVGHNSALG